jgi:Family of unknown function (DUF5519)
MLLSAKGRFVKPPVLKPIFAQALAEALAQWPKIHARTHWLLGDEHVVDGADFYVGEEELGHIHLNGETHIAVGRALGSLLIRESLAEPFRYSRDFVVWRVDSKEAQAHASWLFSLRYKRLLGESEAMMAQTIASVAKDRLVGR